jgi:hypothetical protein
MDIRDDLERIHVAKVAGKPLMHCLREVVWISARIHRAAKFSGDDIRRRAPQAAWDAAVEYDWVVTEVERATAQGFLRAYADQWIAEALSGKPDAITKSLEDIRNDLERIHAAKVAGKPVVDCLQEVVCALARTHLDAKFSSDEIRWRAPQAAWEAAVEYGWVVTDVERTTAQGFLRAYADQWIAEALSGKPDAITKPLEDLARSGKAPRAAGQTARYPTRATWLRARLEERDWNVHDVESHNGPDHKTTKKVLDGFAVREGVLEKLTSALSQKYAKVELAHIPQK